MNVFSGRLLFVLIAFSSPWLLPAWGRAQTNDMTKLIEGAKKEKELVIYGSTTLGQATIIDNKFHDKYPFIEVKLNRLTSDNLYPRVLAEQRSGKFLADLLQNNTLGMYFLRKGKFLDPYVSPEERFYPKELKDPGYWVTSAINVHVIAYNTRAVAREKLPKTWEDLLKPEWKGGKILLNPDEQWFAWILQIMGKEKGLNYMRALAKQKPVIRRDPRALRTQLIIAGEAEMELDSTYSTALPLIKHGAPLGWTTLGPALLNAVGYGLAVRAPHPNAAKLFINFILSKEGQQVVLSLERQSARLDLAQEQEAVKNIQMVPLDPSQGGNMEFYARQAQEIFGN
jgi:ABC-type Fe3+ transport system substrate-binding protein